MRKRLVAGALAAGMGLTVGGVAVGAEDLIPAHNSDKHHKVLRAYSAFVEGVDTEAFLVGPPGSGGMGEGEPEFVDGVGFMFTETIWASNAEGEPYGDPIGRAVVECRVIGVVDPHPDEDGEEGETATSVCEGVLRLSTGDLFIEGAFDFAEEDEGIHGGISSGSRHYEGANGGFTVTDREVDPGNGTPGEDRTASLWEIRLDKADHKH